MSFALDANLLLYASDEESPHQARAEDFLRQCVEGSELFCLAWPTVLGYLRIATHPSIFTRPLTPAQAEGNVDNLLSQPHVRTLAEQPGFWQAYREVTRGLVVRGNLVPDAHLATILFQHGIRTLYTTDSEFRLFASLRIQNPLA